MLFALGFMGEQRRSQNKTQEYLSSAGEPPPPLLPAAFLSDCQALSRAPSKKGRSKEGEHVMCVESQVVPEGKCSS